MEQNAVFDRIDGGLQLEVQSSLAARMRKENVTRAAAESLKLGRRFFDASGLGKRVLKRGSGIEKASAASEQR